MKLIVEKIGEQFFVYRESNKHFKQVQRDTPRFDSSRLDNDCEVTDLPDFHMVFDLKKRK